MDSGIGAARANNNSLLGRDFLDRLLKFGLNGGMVFLNLPPVIFSSVVLNNCFVVLHHGKLHVWGRDCNAGLWPAFLSGAPGAEFIPARACFYTWFLAVCFAMRFLKP